MLLLIFLFVFALPVEAGTGYCQDTAFIREHSQGDVNTESLLSTTFRLCCDFTCTVDDIKNETSASATMVEYSLYTFWCEYRDPCVEGQWCEIEYHDIYSNVYHSCKGVSSSSRSPFPTVSWWGDTSSGSTNVYQTQTTDDPTPPTYTSSYPTWTTDDKTSTLPTTRQQTQPTITMPDDGCVDEDILSDIHEPGSFEWQRLETIVDYCCMDGCTYSQIYRRFADYQGPLAWKLLHEYVCEYGQVDCGDGFHCDLYQGDENIVIASCEPDIEPTSSTKRQTSRTSKRTTVQPVTTAVPTMVPPEEQAGLSTAAKAGIGIGVALAVLLVIAAVVGFATRKQTAPRKRQRLEKSRSQPRKGKQYRTPNKAYRSTKSYSSRSGSSSTPRSASRPQSSKLQRPNSVPAVPSAPIKVGTHLPERPTAPRPGSKSGSSHPLATKKVAMPSSKGGYRYAV